MAQKILHISYDLLQAKLVIVSKLNFNFETIIVVLDS